METTTQNITAIYEELTPLSMSGRMVYLSKMPDEQMREQIIALWACREGFDDLRVKSPPTQPKEVLEYFNCNSEIRKQMNAAPEKYEKFWQKEPVHTYFETVNKVLEANRANLGWLEWILKHLPAEFVKERRQVEARIVFFRAGQESAWEE